MLTEIYERYENYMEDHPVMGPALGAFILVLYYALCAVIGYGIGRLLGTIISR